MNAGVSSKKEKVKESQSQSRSVTSSLDTHFGCRVGGVTQRGKYQHMNSENQTVGEMFRAHGTTPKGLVLGHILLF